MSNNPQRFLIETSPLVAEKFRRLCWQKQIRLNHAIEDLMIEYLIAEGVIDSRLSLQVEEEMTK